MNFKVALITNFNLYESKRHFACKLKEAFQRHGCTVSLFDAEISGSIDAFTEGFLRNQFDFSCSFNRSPPDNERFFWDIWKLPHISFLVDPILYDMKLLQSPYAIITCVDRFDYNWAKSQNFQNVLFWPHAIERELDISPGQQKPYDVVLLGSCYDHETLRKWWQKRYPQNVSKMLDDAIEIGLADNCTSFWEALNISLKLNNIAASDQIVRWGNLVDNYMRGKDRVELIRSIKDAPIHVFGGTCWRDQKPIKGWTHYLAGLSNVTVYPAVSFSESLEILKKSKFSLNSMPFFKNGTHERIFTSLACHSLPINMDNIWVRENFIDGQEILLYQYKHLEDLNDKVNEYLHDEEKRHQAVVKGRDKVMREHTWDQRVEQLLKELPPILERVKNQH